MEQYTSICSIVMSSTRTVSNANKNRITMATPVPVSSMTVTMFTSSVHAMMTITQNPSTGAVMVTNTVKFSIDITAAIPTVINTIMTPSLIDSSSNATSAGTVSTIVTSTATIVSGNSSSIVIPTALTQPDSSITTTTTTMITYTFDSVVIPTIPTTYALPVINNSTPVIMSPNTFNSLNMLTTSPATLAISATTTMHLHTISSPVITSETMNVPGDNGSSY